MPTFARLYLILFICTLPATAFAEKIYHVNDAPPGGLYLATETAGQVARAPVLASDVEIDVTGPIVRTRVTQHFTNTGTAWVEGLYTYPLPKGAAVDTLEMQVGDRVITGQIKEKQQARHTYEQAQAQGKRASLVVQHRPNIFSTRLANIGPGETVSVSIEFQDLIEPRQGVYELRFPMVVRPRYNPGTPLNIGAAGSGHNTTQVPDGAAITPPYLHEDTKINPVNLTIKLAPGFPLGALASPSHSIQTAAFGEDKVITLGQGPVPADQDFILRWQPQAGAAPTTALFTEQTDKGTHQLLLLSPANDNSAKSAPRQPREVTIVLDKSGSMSGQAIDQAKGAVRRALLSLHAEDHFNLVVFDHNAAAVFTAPKAANTINLDRALEYLGNVYADGGTEMATALQLALPGIRKAENGALQQIIFITDGAVGNESALMAQIKRDIGAARLFTIGIGSAPNSYFMEEAAHFGHGTYMNIAMSDDVGERMSKLFAQIETPQITDVRVNWPGQAPDTAGTTIPDLYAGLPIVLAFRSDVPLTGMIELTGLKNGTAWKATIDTASAHAGTGISGLWARRKIKAIERKYMDRFEPTEQDQRHSEILQVALGYHLVSDVTSLVAVEDTPVRPLNAPEHKTQVPSNLPAGMTMPEPQHYTIAYGSETPAGSGALVMARATATPMQLFILLGSIGAVLSLMVLLWMRRSNAAT